MKLTILTRPASIKAAVTFKFRNFLRFLQRFFQGQGFSLAVLNYGGHSAVSRSLVEGLKKTSENFIFNPISVSQISKTVIVLSGVEALKQAIELKSKGKIKKLFAGPNVMEMPDDFGNILSSPEIDAVLVPSQMAKEIYERLNPNLVGKIKIWYAGVNSQYFKPNGQQNNRKQVLVYWKNPPRMLGIYVERLLKKYGFTPKRIIFGKYSKGSYRRLLSESLFSVFLSITETQGLGLAESWSMNVPSLIWNPKIEHYYIKNLQTTAAPYLTKATGIEWKELGEFEKLLQGQSWMEECRPRNWIIKNMTDEKCAKILVEICNPLKLKKNTEVRGDRIKISVCIPTYTYAKKSGGVEFLEHSLNMLLKQTYKDFEVVITDDSAADDVKNLCEKYQKEGLSIKYFKNEKPLGMSANTNQAMKMANGDLIKVLYQDDFLFDENSLQEIADNFEGQWMITGCVHTTDGINFEKPFYPYYNNKIYTGRNTLGSPSVLTVKNDNPMMFDENLKWVLDCDYYKRMYEKFGEPKILNEINIGIRLSKYQTSSLLSSSFKKQEINQVIKKYQ